MRLTDNTILITGGTSGIGRALAEALHKQGNHVIIAGRRQNLLDEIVAANPGMSGMQLDVDEPGAIESFAARVRQEHPTLNVLINNAGIMRSEDYNADAVDLAVAEATLQTNVFGVIQLTAALLPHLKRQENSAIVTTTSGLAFVPSAYFPTYSGTKAFLHSWMQSLRYQLRNTPVEVLELAPPYVQTELTGSHQATDPAAMPLDEYIAEVMQILGGTVGPEGEILVERVKPLRMAEAKGSYAQMFSALNPPN